MSDEEEAGGFGDASDSEEDAGGFGGADEDEEEVEAGFGALEASEGEEDGGDFGAAADEEEESAGFQMEAEPEPPKPKDDTHSFEKFAAKHIKSPNTGSYQLDGLKAPLLKVDKKLSATAVNTFTHVSRWLGITAKIGKATVNTIKTAAEIIKPALKELQLRDETYCQLMKQMTENPASSSRARGVILLTILIGSFAPSKVLLPVVRKFIADGPPGFIPYQRLLLRRTLHNGARTEPPAQMEITSAKKKQIARVQISTDMMTGNSNTARLDPASVCQEWVDEIANREGVKDAYGFTVFVNRLGKLTSMRGAGGKGMHIMDIISKLDQEAAKKGEKAVDFAELAGSMSFQKQYFRPDHDSMKDPAGTLLTYHQIQAGMKEGIYLCKTDEDWNTLAAIMFYAEYGEVVDDKEMVNSIEKWLPASALATADAKKRFAPVSKAHAKGDFSRKQFSATQTQDLLIKYALENWSMVNSFSSDGALMLVPNGKKLVKRNSSKKSPAKKKSMKKK